MRRNAETIRQQFLAIACQYLFGHRRSELCTGGLRLQPILTRVPVRHR